MIGSAGHVSPIACGNGGRLVGDDDLDELCGYIDLGFGFDEGKIRLHGVRGGQEKVCIEAGCTACDEGQESAGRDAARAACTTPWPSREAVAWRGASAREPAVPRRRPPSPICGRRVFSTQVAHTQDTG